MADHRKTTNSSMVDLKAELFRKQAEYKQLKAQNTSDFVKGIKTNVGNKPGKGDIWSKKNAGVLQRASKDLAEKEEEDNVMERSRKALVAKSLIYDKIASSSGIPDDDGSEGYLVDFQRKAVDRIVEQRRGERNTQLPDSSARQSAVKAGNVSEDDDDGCSDEPVPLPANSGEEWVDYVDSFGRSRRCMRKDLPDMGKQEPSLGKSSADGGLKLKEGATLLSADMKRELRRQQWEREAELSANGPTHYANVQFDEIRSHGTGFYQFSKDSNLREEQMETLNKLRDQTTDARQRSERIKEKRKTALEARLAKVKQRRKMKTGGVMELTEQEENGENKTKDASQGETTTTDVHPAEPLTRDDSWRRTAPVREWDIGKEKLPEWNAKRYMEGKRKERENEFAPPQFYYDQKPAVTSTAVPGQTFNPGDDKPHPEPDLGPRYQAVPPPSSNTDAMLKQIRRSVEASSSGNVGQTEVPSLVQRGIISNTGNEPGIDLVSIPLPPSKEGPVRIEQRRCDGKSESELGGDWPQAGSVWPGSFHTPVSARKEEYHLSKSETVIDEWQRFHHSGQNEHFTGSQWQKAESVPVHSGSFKTPAPVVEKDYGQETFSCPAFDMSVPPPGYTVQVPRHQTNSTPLPHSIPPSSDQQETPQPSSTPFIYPSQQGLLTSQLPKPTQVTSVSHSNQDFMSSQPPKCAKITSVPHSTTVTKPPKPKVGMVDRRFMQNREVSDEDLLGYIAHSSDDALSQVKAVSYTPGIFSSSATSQQHQSQTKTNLVTESSKVTSFASGVVNSTTSHPNPESASVDTPSAETKRQDRPAAQTEGVIFGVPDFLQPANIAATSYQPGSFMAAKEAAAQRAEEDYEEARKKTQYSGAPVLYGQPDSGEGGVYTAGDCGKGDEKSKGSDKHDSGHDDEYVKFMKEVGGGK